MGGGAEIFELLVGEDVDGNKMDLGVTVLAGLGGGHFDNLARAVLDADETVLPQSRALHGVGGGGTGIGALEGVLLMLEECQFIAVDVPRATFAKRAATARQRAGNATASTRWWWGRETRER